MDITQDDLTFNWKKAIWSLKTSPKTKQFVWKMWLSAPVLPRIEYNESIALRTSWISLVTKKNLPTIGVAEGQLAPWFLWHIWTARNRVVFNDKFISATNNLSKALAAAREWNACQQTDAPTNRVVAPVATTTTNSALIKTDAAWNGSLNVAGLGWTVETQQ
ncbi:PREDICTED: uncharacterized protein LOC106302359 [Brassica oleracea var. oleracea]|uniref:uncharacterized protein LOC106302359 n=1 Tax=Brassica oleracea var. oleracea TaxID=109376 RepID=UPI0006A738B5|nr:PREDICTED: uncharacterized protein LOC106302359 [Brassica oleracea var. oleracea]